MDIDVENASQSLLQLSSDKQDITSEEMDKIINEKLSIPKRIPKRAAIPEDPNAPEFDLNTNDYEVYKFINCCHHHKKERQRKHVKLQKGHQQKRPHKDSEDKPEVNNNNNIINMTTSNDSSCSSKNMKSTNQLFVIDSGASKTYYNDISLLSNYKERKSTVMLGDERKMLIHGVGSHGLLHDVSFAPDLRLNLISTKSLCIENNFIILFIHNKAIIIDKNIS
jgi:hypothetical protein